MSTEELCVTHEEESVSDLPATTTPSSVDAKDLADDAYVDISPLSDGGILKLVKRRGAGTDRPLPDDNVFIHYAVSHGSGQACDYIRQNEQPFSFVLGKGDAMKGIQIGLATMTRGEKAILRCRSDYACDDATRKLAGRDSDALVVYEVELLDFYGMDVTDENSGLLFKTRVTKGEDFGSPNEASVCDIHIVGKLAGCEFENRDVKFTLGEGSEVGIVEGIELGLRRLTRGELARFRVNSVLAYGNEGYPSYNIPPNADLDYEVKLNSFIKGKEFWDLDTVEKLQYSREAKEKGTRFYQTGKFKVAKFHYSRIVEYLQFSDNLGGEEGVERDQLVLAAHLNLALCHLKLFNPDAAVQSAGRALEIDHRNVKALFRRGLAYEHLNEFEAARNDFSTALEIDPDNRAARSRLATMVQKIREQREKERKKYAGMFDKFAMLDAREIHQQVI